MAVPELNCSWTFMNLRVLPFTRVSEARFPRREKNSTGRLPTAAEQYLRICWVQWCSTAPKCSLVSGGNLKIWRIKWTSDGGNDETLFEIEILYFQTNQSSWKSSTVNVWKCSNPCRWQVSSPQDRANLTQKGQMIDGFNSTKCMSSCGMFLISTRFAPKPHSESRSSLNARGLRPGT